MAPGGPERLDEYLRVAGIPAELVFPGRPTPTVSAAAVALGVAPSRIVKSLLFQGTGGDLALVVIGGDQRVDRRKLAMATGLRQPALAAPEVVLRVTGYPVGGTPPVGHQTPLPVLLDRTLLSQSEVYGGGGSGAAMLRIAPRDIVRLTGATVADLRVEGAG